MVGLYFRNFYTKSVDSMVLVFTVTGFQSQQPSILQVNFLLKIEAAAAQPSRVSSIADLECNVHCELGTCNFIDRPSDRPV